MRAARVGFATAHADGLALGDPSGTHVLLSQRKILYTTGRGEVVSRFDWRDVEALELDAKASAWHHPGRTSLILGAIADSMGLDWGPSVADLTVIVTHGLDRHSLDCAGYIGSGYWEHHLHVLRQAALVLVEHPSARKRLAEPERMVNDMLSLYRRNGHNLRETLTGLWA